MVCQHHFMRKIDESLLGEQNKTDLGLSNGLQRISGGYTILGKYVLSCFAEGS